MDGKKSLKMEQIVLLYALVYQCTAIGRHGQVTRSVHFNVIIIITISNRGNACWSVAKSVTDYNEA